MVPQELFQALCSGMIPGSTRGIIEVPGIKLGLVVCKTSTLIPVSSL